MNYTTKLSILPLILILSCLVMAPFAYMEVTTQRQARAWEKDRVWCANFVKYFPYPEALPESIGIAVPIEELEFGTDGGGIDAPYIEIEPPDCNIAFDIILSEIYQPMVLELSTDANTVVINIPDVRKLYQYVSWRTETPKKVKISIQIGDAEPILINPPERN